MSIEMMTKAWKTNQKGNDLLVLLAMCDFANDEGVLFPSLKTLGSKAKVGKSTLSYILRAYESIGVITRTHRQRENKSDTSTMYKINHFAIDVKKYKEAYQEARNYKKSSHCEHPEVHIVNTPEVHNVNTLNANCEHLEPSYINHQLKEKNIKRKISPKNIIEFYYKNISTKQQKLKEIKSVNAMALIPKDHDLEMVLLGLENYSKSLPKDKYMITNLLNFIENRIYLDYQVLNISSQKDKTNDLVDEVFNSMNQNKKNIIGEISA